jgi:PAS domain S-box-containing protein
MTEAKATSSNHSVSGQSREMVPLSAEDDRFRLALQASPDGFLMLSSVRDEAGEIISFIVEYANLAAAQSLNSTLEELVGQSLFDLFPNCKTGSMRDRYIAVAKTGISDIFETPDNKELLRCFRHVVVKLNDSIAISFSDITERKRSEAALQEREAELRLITDTVPVLISFVDAEQHYRFVNQRYEEWFNLPASEVCGQHICKVLGETVYQNVRPYVEQALAGHQVTFESHILYKGADPRLVSVTYIPQFDEQEKIIGFVALVNDVTENRQVEETLRQSEERYRYLTESIPQLVWTANGSGVLLDVNQRWSSFTGLTLAQARAEGWTAVVHPDDVATLGRNWAIAQQEGTNYQAEGRMRRADGVYRWHLHQAVPLKDAEGRVIKWFGTATDIEDKKQLEQQRINLLSQEQAAREQAEAANRIKDEFLAVLSHELRSPLNPILGWSRLLQTRQFDSEGTNRALQTIERNAKLQAQLIEDLLDVSRILRGKLVLNVCPVNLVAVIESALETVRLAAEAKQIQIQTVLPTEQLSVSGDAARLQQIVWNLLSNAVKFTPDGGQIDVLLDRVDTYARIQVKDTGRGIQPSFLPYVFDYFRQEDGKTTRKFGGLGLGLAIVKHLAELHGGTVFAESLGEGQGATFAFQLPLMAANLESEPSPKDSSQVVDLSQLRVLIVDDEADMRELGQFVLEQQGAQVSVAASAIEALQMFDRQPPDLLISDIGMPIMDGYMLIRQIRSRSPEQGGRVLAIALTAYAGEYDQRQALVAGFQQHLPKPVEPEVLVSTIAALLNRKGGQA